MVHTFTGIRKMFKLITLKVILVLLHFVEAENLSNSYAKVATTGSNSDRSPKEHTVTPKIYKSLYTNLEFLTPTTKVTEEPSSSVAPDTSLGRSYTYSDSYHGYPNRQRYTNYHRTPTIVYPQRRLSNKHFAMDRYTPGEAVATAQFKKNKEGYKYSPPKMKPSRPSGVGYVPPKDIYAFPPNTDSNYLPPTKPVLRKPISSYIPPPAGLPDLGFLGPVNPEYLPPALQKSKPDENAAGSDAAKMPTTSDMQSSGQNNDDMLPALSSDESSLPKETDMDSMKNSEQSGHSYNDEMKDSPEHDMAPEHDLPPDHDMPPEQDMPANTMDMPPGMSDSSSDLVIPSDNFHFHSDHYGAHGVDAYPEVIFDDHDHHNFHHDHHDYHHHPPEVMTTTTTMKPEPPPEPRVKKYSYFYLGRKLWYIPLYFTVWFSFYIFWLIIKSIARHKVNLPNHYTGRMMKRETIYNSASPKSLNYINDLTTQVTRYIEEFDRKYLVTK